MTPRIAAVMRLLIILLSVTMLLGSIPAVRAQDSGDIGALNDRLNRIERDLNALERQVYGGGGVPAAAGTAAPAASGPAALQTEDRLSDLETKIRDLDGQIQVINHSIGQLNDRINALASDVDMRLTALEHGRVAGENPPPAQPGPTPAQPDAVSAQTNGAPATGATATTPAEQYQNAFALLRRADYPGAEQALRAFIAQHPKDPLAGNAQYWLGETYYVRRNWKDAAIAFAEGYQKYPRNSKAPDDLLKLAMSLGNMGQKADACTALRHLDHDFPRMPANVRGPAASEKQHLGC
jgi:tol-pal system protein YbgF